MCRKYSLPVVLALLAGMLIARNGKADPDQHPHNLPSVANANRRISSDDNGTDLSDEMRERMAAVRAEEQRRQLLENCKRLGELSDDLATRYQGSPTLTPGEFKKLGAIKKLARKILTSVGGEELDHKSFNQDQLTLTEAIGKLKVAALNVRKGIADETAFVVHLSVISDSNEVIRLAETLRRSQKH